MAKTLCLDYGNTRKKFALFHGDQVLLDGVLAEDEMPEIWELLRIHRPENSILSSVIDHSLLLEKTLLEQTRFHKLSHHTQLGFTTPVGRPETIGADRLALAAAAVHFFPRQNNLVVALGSCITYNFISQQHEFLGGAISPGMEMRFKAMHEHTAKLPLARKNWNFPVIGYDTVTNLQSGVLAGISFEIQGYIDFYENKFGNFNVVLTGGDARYFARQLKKRIFADLNFLFKGLYAISEGNNC